MEINDWDLIGFGATKTISPWSRQSGEQHLWERRADSLRRGPNTWMIEGPFGK
jgi:hypothetical protein